MTIFPLSLMFFIKSDCPNSVAQAYAQIFVFGVLHILCVFPLLLSVSTPAQPHPSHMCFTDIPCTLYQMANLHFKHLAGNLYFPENAPVFLYLSMIIYYPLRGL